MKQRCSATNAFLVAYTQLHTPARSLTLNAVTSTKLPAEMNYVHFKLTAYHICKESFNYVFSSFRDKIRGLEL